MANMDDFLTFVVQLAMDAKEHPEEWENTTITDYLGQMAGWIDDYAMFDNTSIKKATAKQEYTCIDCALIIIHLKEENLWN